MDYGCTIAHDMDGIYCMRPTQANCMEVYWMPDGRMDIMVMVIGDFDDVNVNNVDDDDDDDDDDEEEEDKDDMQVSPRFSLHIAFAIVGFSILILMMLMLMMLMMMMVMWRRRTTMITCRCLPDSLCISPLLLLAFQS